MSEPDNFLSRWSRRKRAAAEQKAEPDQTGIVNEPAAQTAEEEAGPAKPVATRPPELRAPAPAEPAFDVSSLPPIDSIVADTDISAFLKPGVPSALRHAALRRAWTTDPAIRDFKGLAENDWDFNDPDAIPGFGKLDADFDVRKLVAQVFGEKTSDAAPAESAAPAASEQPAHASQQSDDTVAPSAPTTPAAVETSQVDSGELERNLLQREGNIAMQQDESPLSRDLDKPRRHGGALPQVFPEY